MSTNKEGRFIMGRVFDKIDLYDHSVAQGPFNELVQYFNVLGYVN
jgi:hypothetical protein